MTTITALPTAPSRADPSTFATRSDAWVEAFTTVTVGEINTVAGEINAAAGDAAASEAAADASADAAALSAVAADASATAAATSATTALNAPGTNATSTTSLTVGTGSQAFTIQAGKAYVIGQFVTIASTASPVNSMSGAITAYNSGTGAVTVNVTAKSGSGTFADWTVGMTGQPASSAGISTVITATGNTTLTSTPTLLKITPASYGVTVTLPDATTCALGGPLHIIDNRGAYPVRVCDSTGTLKGFIFAGVVSHISLDDNSTAAGVWAIENNELVGASAQLLTTNITEIDAVIDIGSSQELVIGRGSSNANVYGVVYNRATNTFGSVTLIRTATIPNVAAVLSGANQVLVVSCTATTAFAAVALSISGTTITVNTAATTTLSANISAFADGCGLIAVGSSFVTSYTVSTPAAQIRALRISGTTVTIGSASVLSGTDAIGGLIAASGSIVLAASSTSGTLYCAPYTVSSSTLTLGTGASRVQAVSSLKNFAPLGTRWALISSTSTNGVHGTICSLSGTTITMSTVADMLGTGVFIDAIIVGSNKVLVLGTYTTNNANILTDTAGTASAGTAITLDGGTLRACLYTSGTDAYVGSYVDSIIYTHKIACSGASPVKTLSQNSGSTATLIGQSFLIGSNAVLSRTPQNTYSTAAVYGNHISATTMVMLPVLKGSNLTTLPRPSIEFSGSAASSTSYRGKAASEVWRTDAATVITKLECVL